MTDASLIAAEFQCPTLEQIEYLKSAKKSVWTQKQQSLTEQQMAALIEYSAKPNFDPKMALLSNTQLAITEGAEEDWVAASTSKKRKY